MEGRDRLVLAKDSDWHHYRRRIRGIHEAIRSGEADDDEAKARTVEQIEKEDPEALEPLPYEQGLAVALKSERGSRERQFQPAARGEKAKGKAKAKGKEGSDKTVRFQRAAAELPAEFSKFSATPSSQASSSRDPPPGLGSGGDAAPSLLSRTKAEGRSKASSGISSACAAVEGDAVTAPIRRRDRNRLGEDEALLFDDV